MSAGPEAERRSSPGAAEDRANAVSLNERYRIYPGAPVPELDSPSARAYAAEDDLASGTSLFCLVCSPAVPPRLQVMEQLRRAPEPGHLRLVDYGACFWPPLQRRVLVALFERPAGERLSAAGLGLSASDLARRVVAPIAEALQQFNRRGLTHRAIRPDNLFWSDGRRQAVVLGECVTAPPGHDQPAAYETVENGLAHPSGRSQGRTQDDLYALGMTVLALCRRTPPPDLAADALAVRKLEQGSAAALIGEAVPSPELMPLLRGLLCDDPEQRWGLDELSAWLRNERVLLLRPNAPVLAFRPFRLGETQYRTARSLAIGLSRNGATAAAAIRGGHIEQWLRNSARDEKTADAIEKMRRTHSRFGRDPRRADDTLVARACILLDPEGPLRFGALSAMPDGLGTALYALAAEGAPLDDYTGLIEAEIPAWLPTARVQALPAFQGWVDRMRAYLAQRGLGGGVERCLYEMNLGLPCLGEALSAACVGNLEEFLATVEDGAKTADFATSPIDAHGAAFAISHLAARRALPPNSGLRDAGKLPRPLFELRLLAAVQQAVGNPPLPLLSRWLAHRGGPLVETLHNRRQRKRLSAAVERRKESGRLGELLELLDDKRLWREDAQGFAAAQEQFRRNRTAAAQIEAGRTGALTAAFGNGQEVAVIVALTLGALLMTVALLLQAG